MVRESQEVVDRAAMVRKVRQGWWWTEVGIGRRQSGSGQGARMVRKSQGVAELGKL